MACSVRPRSRREFPAWSRSSTAWIACGLLVAAACPVAPLRALAAPAETAPPRTNVPGTGWLGMKVGESAEPGRWVVTEVASDGPAAAGGLRVNDEIRAMHGHALASLDEVAEAVTSVAAGQQVPVALARDGRPLEVVLVAQQRPVRPTGQSPLGGASSAVVPTAGTDVGDRYSGRTKDSLFSPATDDPGVPAEGPGIPPRPLPDDPARTFSDGAPDRTVGATRAPGPSAWGAAQTAPNGASPARLPPPAREPAVLPAPVKGNRERPHGRTALGVRTVPIDASTQARFRLPRPSGAYVIGVVGELPAWKAGLPAGSVIVALGERPVNSPEDLTQLVNAGPVDRPLPIHYVLPGGEQKRADVVLQSLDLPLERALVGPETETVQPPVVRRSERPLAPADDVDVRALHDEVLRLRERLDWLERRLGGLPPRTP